MCKCKKVVIVASNGTPQAITTFETAMKDIYLPRQNRLSIRFLHEEIEPHVLVPLIKKVKPAIWVFDEKVSHPTIEKMTKLIRKHLTLPTMIHITVHKKSVSDDLLPAKNHMVAKALVA